jgi:hypothetical protein
MRLQDIPSRKVALHLLSYYYFIRIKDLENNANTGFTDYLRRCFTALIPFW